MIIETRDMTRTFEADGDCLTVLLSQEFLGSKPMKNSGMKSNRIKEEACDEFSRRGV